MTTSPRPWGLRIGEEAVDEDFVVGCFGAAEDGRPVFLISQAAIGDDMGDPEDDALRTLECVNAMDKIEDPLGFLIDIKETLGMGVHIGALTIPDIERFSRRCTELLMKVEAFA